MKNKKAMSSVVMAIIITLFALLVIGVFLGNFAYGATNQAKVGTCDKSITAADARIKQSILKKAVLPNVDLNCERIPMPVTLREYETKDDKINYEKIRSDIAENMIKAWSTAGNGEKDPFTKKPGCLVMYEITFDKKFIEQQNKEASIFDDFDEWLKEHSPKRITESYHEYMDIKMHSGFIDTSKKQAIIWRRGEGDESSIVIVPEADMLNIAKFGNETITICEHPYN